MEPSAPASLFQDLSTLIEQGKRQLAVQVNQTMTLVCWRVGKRNPLIASVLFRAGYIDLWGYGTVKIFRACQAAGLPAPEIEEVFGGVLVKLRAGGQKGGTMGGTIGGAIGGTDGGTDGLSDREKEIITLVEQNAFATYRGIAKKLEINVSAVQKHIEKLKEKGILERIGGTRGHWQVNLS